MGKRLQKQFLIFILFNVLITLQFLHYCIFELPRPDTPLFRVKIVSNNNSSLAKVLAELSLRVSLSVRQLRVKITWRVVLNAWGVPDLTRIDNRTASEVVLLLVRSDESSGLSRFPVLSLYLKSYCSVICAVSANSHWALFLKWTMVKTLIVALGLSDLNGTKYCFIINNYMCIYIIIYNK